MTVSTKPNHVYKINVMLTRRIRRNEINGDRKRNISHKVIQLRELVQSYLCITNTRIVFLSE